MESTAQHLTWSIQSRISSLRNAETLADVQFVVGNTAKTFYCHKLILAAASEVFQVMFYGRIQEDSRVVIPDVTPEGFEILLEYMYSDNIKIKSPSDAFETSYAAKKYLLKELFAHCENYLMCHLHLNYENACCVYEKASFLEMKFLKHRCQQFIARNFLDIVHSESFYEMSKSRLREIIAADVLEIESEFDVAVALLNWTEFQCQKLRMRSTRKNIRAILDNLLEHIRFLVFTVPEFQKLAKKYDFLEASEEMSILLNIALPQKVTAVKMPNGFGNLTQERTGINYIKMPVPVEYRYNQYKTSNIIPGHQQKASIEATKRCQIGITGIICGMTPLAGYLKSHRYLNVEISLVNYSTKTRAKAKICMKPIENESSGGKEMVKDIWFDDPLYFQENQVVELIVWVEGEGVQLPQLLQEESTVHAYGTEVVFKVADKTMENKDFIVKELVFI